MARIEGVDLPRNKRVEVGLTYIFGIGPTRARTILAATSVNPDIRVKDLSEAEVNALREFIGRTYKVEGDLRREVQMNIKRLIEIGCYRGLRHRRNLPVQWPAHPHQFTHPQGSQEDCCRSWSPPRRKEIISNLGSGQVGYLPSHPAAAWPTPRCGLWICELL